MIHYRRFHAEMQSLGGQKFFKFLYMFAPKSIRQGICTSHDQ